MPEVTAAACCSASVAVHAIRLLLLVQLPLQHQPVVEAVLTQRRPPVRVLLVVDTLRVADGRRI